MVFAAWLCAAGLVLPRLGGSPAAEPAPEEGLLQMIVELVSDSDRDMRALGLQQVREEAPGEAATKTFVSLLPKLPPDSRAALLEALGERGDAAARPAVLEMLKSQEEVVRVAALKAVGGLGGASEASLLAQKTVQGLAPEKNAARQSLVRLRGDGVNAAIVAALEKAAPEVKVELLGILAARNAKETVAAALNSAAHSDPSVRLAAIGALRFLADEQQTAAMVGIAKAAKDDAQRRKAELALLAVCSRGRQKCAEAVIAGLADADAPSRILLLRSLARCGGAAALEAIVARLDDKEESVRDEAMRMLSSWPDAAAMPHLLKIANQGESLRRQVLAIRGLLRLASPQTGSPPDWKLLAEVVRLAKRPQEKRLVLSVLGACGAPQALPLVTPALDDPAVAEEAGLAAVMIAEKMQGRSKEETRAAMEKVLESVKDPGVRDRAKKVLASR